MTIVAANWVGENTSTVGTGPLALSGAISTFCPFSVLPDGSEVYYTLQEGFNRETGIGVVSNGTLTRKVQATLVAGVYTETDIPISLSGNGQVFAVINADFMTRIYNFSLDVADSVTAAAASAQAAADSASIANDYKTQSVQNAENAAVYAQSASNSKDDAAASKNAAAASASAAASSQADALASKNAAASSQADALVSKNAAKTSETNSKNSETTSAQSATNAYNSAASALASQNAAKTSETNAKASETAAKTSETNAKASETAAKTSETNAKASEVAAETARDQVQQIIDDAGEQSTLVVLASGNVGNGDDLVTHVPKKPQGVPRRVSDKLNDIPSILDWASDSANDDSTRIKKAIADGVDSLFIPSKSEAGVFTIGELDIAKNIKLWGNAFAGYRQVGACFKIPDDAEYGLYFKGDSSSSRLIGGGMSGISMIGATTACNADFIRMTHASSMEFSNISARQSGGSAFFIRDTMESRIDSFHLNSLGSESRNPIHIGDYVDSPPWNVNNLHITNGTLGACSGNWIYASDNSNADLVWVQGNKFEWDTTPTNANTSNKSVIYLDGVERAYVEDNGFVYFYPGHNMYDTLVKTGPNARYGIQILYNTAWGCDDSYFWNITGGSVLARGNRSNAPMKVSVSSPHSQDIEPPMIRTKTGNRPPSYFAKQYDSNFTPAHYLTGANASNNFTADPDAVINGTCQLAAASVELRRAVIPKDMVAAGRVVKVTARCKNTNGTDAQIRLICDGTTVTNNNSSLDDGATYLKIPAGSDWANYSWYLTPAMIANGGWMIITNASTTTFLFDGISIEYANSIDLTVPWSASSIPTNTTSSTSVSMPRLGPYIKGVSMPKTDNSLGGAIATTYFEGSTNNLTLLATRVGSTAATVAATSFMIRVFLK